MKEEKTIYWLCKDAAVARYQRRPVEGGSVEDSRRREDKLCQEHCNGINGKLSTPSLEGWPLRTRR